MNRDDASPKVSIVTPSFNQGEYIEKTILSVLCQDYKEIEYIVVDGLSDDKTLEILEKYKQYIDVILIEKDSGQSDALNKGFSLATGDILAYLNSDDCYASTDVISTAVKYFQNYPDVDVIYGRRDIVDECGFLVNFYPYQPFSKPILYLCDYIPQECSFWTRVIYEKAGSYISKEFDFAMDYELWLRFLEFDANFLAVDELFGLFRYYASQKSRAQWHTKGLPEIARLHQKYLNRYIPEAEMSDYFHEYVFGVNPNTDHRNYVFQHDLWITFVALKANLLATVPEDAWAKTYKINPTRQNCNRLMKLDRRESLVETAAQKSREAENRSILNFHSFHYLRHNQRRQEHLASLGLNLAQLNVLEVGAGIGDHTSFFLDRDCQVVVTEARTENLEILKLRYPDLQILHLDLDNPVASLNQQFDVVYCYGVLYHLTKPSEAIQFMSEHCQGLLLLETCVSYGDDEAIHPCSEVAENPTQSIVGQGCRPTRKWVYNQLRQFFEFVYLPITQPNHEEFPLDWASRPETTNLTRSVFIASRQKISNPLLIEGIPTQQQRH